jgi:hypothetical protein
VCGTLFVSVFIVFVAAVVALKCIYPCHYEYTSYALAIYLCMFQWCDNENHDQTQHVKRLLLWRDDVDGNKWGSSLIFSIPVTDTVSIFTCHYMCFPFLLLRADSF